MRSMSAPDRIERVAREGRVRHAEWGEGVVGRCGDDAVTVLFDDAGYRTLELVVGRGLLEAA